MSRFDSFVVFAAMRTGSNFLEANLNAIGGLACHGEAFNPAFIGTQGKMAAFGMTLAEREADPLRLLRAMREGTEGLAGFRYFHDHDPRIFPAVMADPRCAKVVLGRNPIESYVSLKIARQTNQWKLTGPTGIRTAQVTFDGPEFEAHMAELQAFHLRILHGLQTSGQTAFYLDYEDIQDVEVLNGLAAFLGTPGRLQATDDALKKQNPEDITQKVVNPAQMEAALARLDRFNLARTPVFEPRRTPNVPSFLAASEVPLVFMPVRGGPVAAVAGWLSGLGRVETEFTQKTLRQWKRARPVHRSFAVIRHPLLRAHAVFCDKILSGEFAEIRSALTRLYGVEMPEQGMTYPTAGAHRAAFLRFLEFLRRNLAGQTGLRVDAHWASQAAVIQGFTTFMGPDAVLREDRLAEGLEWLCHEVGAPAHPFAPVPDSSAARLAEIHDAELEAAARDAFARDYLTFGFGNWAPYAA